MNKCMKPLCSWLPVLPYCMTFTGSQRIHLIQSKNTEAVCGTYLQSTWKNLHINSTNIKVFWDIMLCYWVSNFQHFKGLKYLLLQGQAFLLEDKAVWFSKTLGTTHPMRQCLIPHGVRNPENEGATSFETLGTIHPLIQSEIPDDLNP